jgi:hypothetical protein
MIASRLSEIALANWVDGQYIMHNSLCVKYINGESVWVKIKEVRNQRSEDRKQKTEC